MQVFTYSEAPQNLSKLLVLAQIEAVEIHRKNGSIFSVVSKEKLSKSPFYVPGINTKATTQNILRAFEESRKG